MKLRAKAVIIGVVRSFPVGQPFTSTDVMNRLPGNYDPIPSEVTHILPTIEEVEKIGSQGHRTIYVRRDPDEV